MTAAYFDCFSGISGDMTLGALIDAGADRSVLEATVDALRLGDEVKVKVAHENRGHAGGTRVTVEARAKKPRRAPALRAAIVESAAPEGVKGRALNALDRLIRAEGRIHGQAENEIHLHELGGADTLIDLLGAFWLLDNLAVERVYASALPAPRGLPSRPPLPAPASLRVLEGTGAELRPVDFEEELVTPTGAAILAACATFTRPQLSLRSVGYGVGARDVPGNLLAVWIGDEVRRPAPVTLIETNLDDMAPNVLAALCEDLMEQGALDVNVSFALMKKGRPGQLLRVLAPADLVARLSEHVLYHSTTLGVRLLPVDRVLAERRSITVRTPLGEVSVKVKELGGKPVDVAPEYEDCRRIARETGTDLREVMRVAGDAARRELGLV